MEAIRALFGPSPAERPTTRRWHLYRATAPFSTWLFQLCPPKTLKAAKSLDGLRRGSVGRTGLQSSGYAEAV